MSKKINIIVGQSGGPTAVINSSLSGVIGAARKNEAIDKVYGMIHGIEGFLDDRYVDLNEKLDDEAVALLRSTPAAYLGSCRYKLPESLEDEIYEVLFAKFAVLGIGAVFYIGGNDSMDTVDKLSRYGKKIGSEVRFIGIPKTVDNDLMYTDHTPGYGSAAKFVATTVRDIIWDCGVYKHPAVTIVEIMGRHAGWLTAASKMARTSYEKNPVLIYLPENAFDVDTFIEDVSKALQTTVSVVVCISEGIADKDGKFICEYGAQIGIDKFGHKMLAGCGKVLENLVKNRIGCKCRSIELNLPQRCSSHLASLTDVTEACKAGEIAVNAAIKGMSGKMVGFKRKGVEEYEIEYTLIDASKVCNAEKKFPSEWIIDNGTNISDEFDEYIIPLIRGENTVQYENGVAKYLRPAWAVEE